LDVRAVGLITNHDKSEAIAFAPRVVEWLEARGLRVRLDAESAGEVGRPELAAADAEFAGLDLLITLGGDGTILAASQLAARTGVPILGVHMGRFGFIAETHPNDLLKHLEDVLQGRAAIEERLMVRGSVVRDGVVVHHAIGLNDIVINKGAMARLLHLRTSFGGDFLMRYAADGVVVATPTGSTAYALSAGGPLVEPTVRALVVAPICPHTLAARPLIVPEDETISVVVEIASGEVLFLADSTQEFLLASGDRVDIGRAECCTRLVTVRRSEFYQKVRKRLLWGERLNA